MKKYKNYIFDLYGTLIDIETNENGLALWKKMAGLYSVYGADYSWRELKKRYSEYVQEEEEILREETGYTYPEIKLEKVKGIVVHYTANPGSTAMENRNYFEGLKDSHKTFASSHFVVGLDGEIIQCIPTKEVAYASNDRNSDTLSIECCHYAENGKFTEKTYSSLVKLCAYLCHRFGLTQDDIIRHYDVTGKNCPKYFVEHPKVWKRFRADVKTALDNKDWNLDIIS